MNKKEKNNTDKPSENEHGNAGSGAFNQGSAQEPGYKEGTPVSDEEKATGHAPSPGKAKSKGTTADFKKDGNKRAS